MSKTRIALGFRPSIKEIKAPSYKMTFGKYKGMAVEEILKIDANYILWLSDEKIAKVSEEILEYADEACTEEIFRGAIVEQIYGLRYWNVNDD